MSRSAAALPQLGRRPSRTGTLVGVRCALLSALAACFGLGPAAFTASLASRSSLRGNARGIRVSCAARGGDAMVAEEYKVGDTVKAFSEEYSKWYPGKIQSVAGDGTFTVTWDDPDGGPETADVGADSLKKTVIFKDYVVGDDCWVESPDDNIWYPGTVTAINEDGTFMVTWDDPDGGPETANIQPEKMKKVTFFKGYKKGDEVWGVFPDDGQWYSATVEAVKTEGTFVVKWDDPQGGPEESELTHKNMKVPPIPVDMLEVGAKYEGTVTKVLDFGAFVDIGAETKGMIHISKISTEHTDNIYRHVEEGQSVEVWVMGVKNDGKVSLTMVEDLLGKRRPSKRADYEAFEGISPSEWLDGKVMRTGSFGAIVLVKSPGGAEASGLVHVSAIKDGYVDDVSSELSEGDEVKVRVLKVDLANAKMLLSMRSDLTPFENLSLDDWFEGKVVEVLGFGAFVRVTLDDGSSACGSVHSSEIKDGFVDAVEDELEVGQDVKVRVLSVDPAAGKMSLSMKGQ